MADLIAQGADWQDRWRRALAAGQCVVLGRAPSGWPAAWDDRISRRHAELCWDGQRLHVRKLAEARNPIFVKGQPAETFEITPGEHFVIGQTTFTLTDERVQVSQDVPHPLQEQTFSADYLHGLRFRRVGPHIDVLSRLGDVIAGADNDAELSVRLVNLLLAGLPRAGATALVAQHDDDAEQPAIDVLHWDRRSMTANEFQPSERLIQDALARSESVLHVWNAADSDAASEFTLMQGIDWAFCTPVPGKACRGWALYVAGRFGDAGLKISDPGDLRDDLKFTELAATTLGALRDVRMLERDRAGLSQFFAPQVLDALAGEPDTALAPRETEVTVLFCDLRGFTRHSERASDDLLGLLKRVSQALGVATHHIREQGGVLGDFHGDAAMGFWGWPFEQPDAALRAARAALAVRAQYAADKGSGDPLSGFQVGIGIANGSAVAGKIGTVDQVKVTVFGPVVNLASRLEGMTKVLHAPILLDERTAAALRREMPADVGRLRRVAVVQPYGFERKLEVTELLPSAAQYPTLSDEHIAHYEHALDDVLAGRWGEAFERLHRVPADDRVKDFLTVLIAQHNRTPPDNWGGVIPLSSK
ncbi:MAG: adenylate/guanylate cyclase domain-containing protein [Planctomycetota bacterium]|nr:MAG: adenylate/guanylate cyclase domain-containing protein [Planctomycetota bacterium]